MELVEGESLDSRLADDCIPLSEALPIARQIAEAIEAAHDKGILHRDLKPANIMLTAEGHVKVLDFGLAKPGGASGAGLSSEDALNSPTMTRPPISPGWKGQNLPSTEAGMILGTAAYMSPEQAKGRPLDRRTDIWAFGCVLYEMLTGTRLFGREDASETLAAVLTHKPNLDLLPASTPAAVRRLLARCLERNRHARLDSMAVVRIEIDDALAGDRPHAAAPRRVATIGLVIAAATGGAVASWMFARGSQPTNANSTAIVVQIPAPPQAITAFHSGFALSPDGKALAFSARDTNGVSQVWLRPLDSATSRAIPGTEDGSHPFWSPDGAHLGFFAARSLKRVPIAGGPAQLICAVGGYFTSGSWNEQNDILFDAFDSKGWTISKVRATGGTPTTLDLGNPAARPHWIAGGSHFLFSRRANGVLSVHQGPADGSSSAMVAELGIGELTGFAYSRSGYLFFNRNGAMSVQRFDNAALRLEGEPVALGAAVGSPKGWFALTGAGTTIVALAGPSEGGDPGDPLAHLQWVTRQGVEVGRLGASGRYWTMRLSPNARSVVVNAGNETWVLSDDHRRLRLAADGSNPGVWSPDGSTIAYSHGRANWLKPLGRDVAEERLAFDGFINDWAPDGSALMVTTVAGTGANAADLQLYDLKSKTLRPWHVTAEQESHARFSPDGRWVAFANDSTGRFEVYVKSLSESGVARPASSGGGIHPAWRSDGRELFFLGPGDEMHAVAVSEVGGVLTLGEPRRLFRIALNDITRHLYAPYDVAPDGQRFLLNIPETPAPLLYMRGIDRIIAP